MSCQDQVMGRNEGAPDAGAPPLRRRADAVALAADRPGRGGLKGGAGADPSRSGTAARASSAARPAAGAAIAATMSKTRMRSMSF
jgi:hypothetical protein